MTHEQVIDRWPSLTEFARDLGIPYQTARFMKKRKSIHPRHWKKIAEKAKERGFRGISIESLARVAVEQTENAA